MLAIQGVVLNSKKLGKVAKLKKRFGRLIRTWYRIELQATHLFQRIPIHEDGKLFVLSVAIGIMCGIITVAFHHVIVMSEELFIDRAIAAAKGWGVLWVVLVPAVGGLLAGILMKPLPDTGGSGIPTVKTAFHLKDGRIPLKSLVGKFWITPLCVGTGASLGPEGPIVMICSGFSSLIGRLFGLSRRQLKNLIPIGAASAIAAIFNTPIAALTFAIEELLGDLNFKPLVPLAVATVAASVVSRTMLGGDAIFQAPNYGLNHPTELAWYFALGALAGLVSVGFTAALAQVRKYFKYHLPVPAQVKPAVAGLLVGLIGLAVLKVHNHTGIFGIGYEGIFDALAVKLPLTVLAVLLAAKLAAVILSSGSGTSGGLFAPSFFIGAMLGGLLGQINVILGGHPHTPGAFALAGMGAVFAAVMRAPITSILLIFELTNDYSIVLPLILADILAYSIAVKLQPVPIYELILKQDGIHLPHHHHLRPERDPLQYVTVGAVMIRAVFTLRANRQIAKALAEAKASGHHGFPVTDEQDRLVGMVSLNDLKRAVGAGKGKLRLTSIIQTDIIQAHPDQPLNTAALKFSRYEVEQLPVVNRLNPRQLLGILTVRDLLRARARAADPDDDISVVTNITLPAVSAGRETE